MDRQKGDNWHGFRFGGYLCACGVLLFLVAGFSGCGGDRDVASESPASAIDAEIDVPGIPPPPPAPEREEPSVESPPENAAPSLDSMSLEELRQRGESLREDIDRAGHRLGEMQQDLARQLLADPDGDHGELERSIAALRRDAAEMIRLRVYVTNRLDEVGEAETEPE